MASTVNPDLVVSPDFKHRWKTAHEAFKEVVDRDWPAKTKERLTAAWTAYLASLTQSDIDKDLKG